MFADMQRAAKLIGARDTSRRQFLQVTSLAGVGFLIGCGQRDSGQPGADRGATTAPEPVAAELNAFVRVASDNTVTVLIKHLDKGQGVTTGLPTIVAEEMDADWSQMRAEFAPANAEVYKNLFFGIQGTGGSSSIANSWLQLRGAAAAARAMLVGAAATAWGVPATQIEVTRGRLVHQDSGRFATFGELAAAAADVAPPAEPLLKDPSDFTLIGTRLPRLDSRDKTDGSATYTADIVRPGMVHAVMQHPPKFGATVKRVNDEGARALAGVSDVLVTPRGVAVVADSYHTATKGRAALDIEWDLSGAESRGSDAMLSEYRAALDGDGLVARNEGDADAALANAAKTVSADFDFPYLAHATMEPLNCVIDLGADRCTIWTGSQLQTVDQQVVAGITGLTPEQVVIHTQFAGGSFGRRAVPDSDYIAEAAMIAKAIDGRAPVKLQWSRENDMRGGRYRPMSAHRLTGALDKDGNIVAWRHGLATQSFMAGTSFEGMIVDGIDGAAVEGARGLPYAIGNLRVEQHLMENGVPTLWWRSVGHTHNAYVTEVFLDQLAAAAGRDPLALRQALLGAHPRLLGVLNLAAEKAGWGSPLGKGHGRGLAVHESFGSFVAEVAHVSVGASGFRVERVVCAVDCGIAVNPDVVRAQMEGGIGYGLSAFLREGITLKDGQVQQSNFHEYRPLRINEMPVVEVHIVPSAEPPTGVGEPGTPVVAPAVANALYAATGRLITSLPLADQLAG